jgi:hypothetical protein
MSGTRSRLIGRSDDLAAVGATLGLAVREQRVTGVIVTGDPGMGKTRLLQEGSAVAEHGCTFHISGFELDRNVSLASAAPMLRELAGSPAAGGRLHEILAIERAGRPLEPLRVFEAAAEAVAHVGPALIVFDDIQWADDASIALCRYLLRAAQSDGAVLSMLAAGRPGKKTDAFLHAVRDLLGEDLAEIDLGPLPFADAETLALAVAPSLSGAEAAELARVSGGMPFWIEVLARRPLREGDPTDAISRRLKGLGTDAAEALALLVVASRPLRAADLEQALSWPPERADTAITDLADRGLVTLSGATLRIAHDLIRERAAAQLPESDRARHHRSLAEWLQRDAGDDIRR